MARVRSFLFAFACTTAIMSAQTAEELVAKNLQAKGGIARIKAIHSFRAVGRLQQGGFVARVGMDAVEPLLLRQTFTMQGMTQIQAYDGSIGWQISPFGGRKDPEQLGEDDLRSMVEEADFYGPLVDYRQKGNTVVDPKDGNTLYACATGPLWDDNEEAEPLGFALSFMLVTSFPFS